MSRPWTTLEERRLVQLRQSGTSYKRCGKILGRTPRAIQSKLRKFDVRIIDHTPFSILSKIVSKWVNKGRCDAWIAFTTGKSRRTIQAVRLRLGLAANIVLPSRKVKCTGCGTTCPIPISKSWVKLSGWMVFRSNGYPPGEDVYCPRCGMMEENTRSGRPEYKGPYAERTDTRRTIRNGNLSHMGAK